MSATVTYKGATLTTATNQTRTLDTAGTYLEDDITITDVTTIPTGTKNISITTNGTTTEDVTSYATASITTAVPASAVDSGTKSISTNGTHDVIGYASANVAVPNSYSASDEGKVVSSGALVSQTAHADVTPTTSDQTIDTTTNNSIKVKGDADLVAGNIKKDVEIFGVTGSYEGGGGGADLSWLAANTPTPNVRNLFYALVNNTAEHGEFTRSSTSTSLTTILTLTNFSDTTPPQGMVFIDKDFYQGESYNPTNSEAITVLWFDKAFINPASVDASGLKYMGFRAMAHQTGTTGVNMISSGFVFLDGSTEIFRAKYKLDGHDFQVQDAYSGNNRYCVFRPSRTYIWIAY